jgi:hypothetical protein
MEEQIKNNIPNNNVQTVDDMKNILQKLVEQNEENHKLLKKIRSYQNQQRIMAYLKILIIVVPIVLSVIYLPSILKPFWDQYQQAIGVNSSDFNMQNLQKTMNDLKNPTQ